jgi:hypothetical protein
MNVRLVSVLLAAGLPVGTVALGATLESLTNQPPAYVGLAPPFLLTDGSVMFQDDSYTGFWKLTPDASGSYLNGTWSQLASLPAAWNYGPYAYSSAVLADGRVLIEGGEYNLGGPFSLTNQGAVYDPLADTWTQVDPPAGWDFIGDASSIVMPNGKFLLGNKLDMRVAELDPATMTWTALGFSGKSDFNAEEGWTLLPDGSFITVDVLDAPNTERYAYTDAPDAGSWTSVGATPASLAWNYNKPPIIFPGGTYTPPGETGQCMLRPDLTVFCTGASDDQSIHIAHSAILDSVTMTWTAGPDFPPGDDAGDTSAVLLPSGNVLVSGTSGQLYEFDGLTLTPTLSPGSAALLVMLPNGQALVNGFDVELYTPDATPAPNPDWAPRIADVPGALIPGNTYQIGGFQFNGLSQAQAFGDEIQAPTNYPLVQITNDASGHVRYARTHDHSTMGVATGAQTPVSTYFDVPAGIEPGTSHVTVVANGITSPSVCVRVLAADTIFADSFDLCAP